MERAALQGDIRKQVSKGRPHCSLKVKGDLSNCWLEGKSAHQITEDCFVVTFLLPRHDNKHERNLLHVVVTPHEGVDGQKLLKRLAAQLEGAINVPGLSTAQNIQLLVTGKDKVTATSDLKKKTNI